MKPAVANSANAIDLKIGGLTRLSSCDWPGQLAATIFCQGCAWSCPYCHNQSLRAANAQQPIAWVAIENFLRSRQALLDAVVFSGGEPTLQAALLPAMETAKRMGFRIGLHTGGPSLRKLSPLVPLLDWVGFDVKAPFAEYQRITDIPQSGEDARASLALLLSAGVEVEARTTVHPALLSAEDLTLMEQELLSLGVKNYVLQKFRAAGVEKTELVRFPALAIPAVGPDFGRDFVTFSQR